MAKGIMFFLGIVILAVSIIILRTTDYGTSGLMLLSVGVVIMIIASVLKFRKARRTNQAH